MGRSCQETAASSKALAPISRLTFMWPPGASEVSLVGWDQRERNGRRVGVVGHVAVGRWAEEGPVL